MKKFTHKYVADLMKYCINNEYYNNTIDFLIQNSKKTNFILYGNDEICFYYQTFLILSIDKLNNNDVYINTNLLQVTTYELNTNKKWNHWNSPPLKDIKYNTKYYDFILAQRKEKLEKLEKL